MAQECRPPRRSIAAHTVRILASRDLEISEGRVKGVEAMVEVLLPIVAVAFGMAVLALVLHFDIGS